METAGVLVIDTGEIRCQNGEIKEPAQNILKPGDYIISFNQQKISCKQDLIENLENINSEAVTLLIKREDKAIPVSLFPVHDSSGKYKL